MKIILLVVLFSVVHPAWQFLFKDFSTTAPPPTPTTRTNLKDKCKRRIWGKCYGDPPRRYATDNCSPKSELCRNGTIIGNKFVESFTPKQKSQKIQQTFFTFQSFPNRIYHNTNSSSKYLGSNNHNYSGAILTRKRRQALNYVPKRDLLFMLDESGSVGEENFRKFTKITASIVKLLCHGQKVALDKTRVSVMSFDSTKRLHIPLMSPQPNILNSNGQYLANYIMNEVRYNRSTAGSTCLNDALLYALNTALHSSQGGRRNQKKVLQEIILLTDGCANCKQNQLQTTVNMLKQANIKVYVIGVGLPHTCQEKLKILAETGNCHHAFFFDEWTVEIDDFVQALEDAQGKECLQQLIGLYPKSKKC